MVETSAPQAWIALASEDEIRARLPDGRGGPYDFGGIADMARRTRAHERIGAAFGALFAEVMFKAGHLSRAEREMVAAVAAAAQDCHY